MTKAVAGLVIGVAMAGGAVRVGGVRAQAVAVSGGINGGAVVGNSLTVGTLNTGTTLQVSGAVSADGRYVTANVDVQASALDGIDTFVIPGTAANGGVPVQASVINAIPFRSAQVGCVVFVDHDKGLLEGRVQALAMKQTSLKAAVRKLADATKGNIVLGIRGLEEAGVDVNLVRDYAVPGGTVKDAVLALLKIGAPDTDMVITAEDRVISIATQAQADNAVVTKTYYLADLMANLPRFVAGNTNLNDLGAGTKHTADADNLPTGQTANAAGTPESRSHADVRSAGTANAARSAAKSPPKSESASTSITALITSTVRPEIWKVNGGKYGEIAVVGDRVTIKAPQSVHALLEGPSRHNPNQVPMYVGYGQ